MKMQSHGRERVRGIVTNLEGVTPRISLERKKTEDVVVLTAHGPRTYMIELTVEEVLRCFMHIPPEQVNAAITAAADSVDATLLGRMPELIMEVSAGVVTARNARALS